VKAYLKEDPGSADSYKTLPHKELVALISRKRNRRRVLWNIGSEQQLQLSQLPVAEPSRHLVQDKWEETPQS